MEEKERDRGFNIQSVGDLPPIESIDAVVFYRREDGAVTHVHHVVTFEGAQRSTDEEREESARRAARQMNQPLDGLQVLHVRDFRPTNRMFRVDPRTQTLEELPLPSFDDEADARAP